MHQYVFFLMLALNGAAVQDKAEDAKAIEAAKHTSVRQIDNSLPDKPFEKWLHDLVGPQTKIAWEVNDCGEQSGNPSLDMDHDIPMCAEAQVLLKDARKLHISLSVGTFKTGIRTFPASFFFAVIVDPDESRHWIKRLTEIPDAIK